MKKKGLFVVLLVLVVLAGGLSGCGKPDNSKLFWVYISSPAENEECRLRGGFMGMSFVAENPRFDPENRALTFKKLLGFNASVFVFGDKPVYWSIPFFSDKSLLFTPESFKIEIREFDKKIGTIYLLPAYDFSKIDQIIH